MTHAELRTWLAARQPAPPRRLVEHLESSLAAYPPSRLAALSSLSEALAAVALDILHGLDGRDPRGESVALDLLAADALVTYAFEAAAESGSDLSAVADSILARLEA